jgi:hypothetical protein
MQTAVQHSQSKVTEYWQKVQAQENLLLEQRKMILSVENRNEQLKLEEHLAAASPAKRGSVAGKRGSVVSPQKKRASSMAQHPGFSL